jgi:hypothetical protein
MNEVVVAYWNFFESTTPAFASRGRRIRKSSKRIKIAVFLPVSNPGYPK